MNESHARLLASAEAIVAAEDDRADAEQLAALLDELEPLRVRIHALTREAMQRRLSEADREMLGWLLDEMEQIAVVLTGNKL